MIHPAPGCHDAIVKLNCLSFLSTILRDPCHDTGRLVAGPQMTVQARVALHVAGSPVQLIYGICKHSPSISDSH